MTTNHNAVQAHSLTDAQVLASLVQRYTAGLQLPSYVIERDGTETPLLAWLDGLRYDRTPFNTHLASQLGLQSDPPWTCEAALTLRGRIGERHS
jgi:hypothetical protein